MTRVLFTGFEPFAGDPSNPSWDAVEAAATLWEGDAEVVTARLPVEFDRVDVALADAIAATTPDLVIAVGLAGGIQDLHLERVAINIDDARIADNAGAQPIDRPISPNGPAAYFTRLPIKAAALALTDAGIASSISQSAGTFVCNHVFYSLLATDIRGGFVHVPFSPALAEGRNAPSMPVDTMARGILVIMQVSLVHLSDELLAGGALH